MLVIRLRRTGKKKKPSFRVVVAEKTMPIYGRFVDIIGNVNLQSDPKEINIDKEKVLDWISKGAQPSHTVARLMVKQGILKEEDVKMNPEKKRTKKKDMKKEGGETKEAPKTGEEVKRGEQGSEENTEVAPTPAEGEVGVPTESVGKEKPVEAAKDKEPKVNQEAEVKAEEKPEEAKEEKPEVEKPEENQEQEKPEEKLTEGNQEPKTN